MTGIATMKKGEKALFKLISTADHPSQEQKEGVEEQSSTRVVRYEIELIDFFDRCKVKWDYTPAERVEKAREFKD